MGRSSALLMGVAVAVGYTLLTKKVDTPQEELPPIIPPVTPPIVIYAKYSVGDRVNTDQGIGKIISYKLDPTPDFLYTITLDNGTSILRAEGEISLFTEPLPEPEPPIASQFSVGDRVHSTLGSTLFLGTITSKQLEKYVWVNNVQYTYMWSYTISLDVGGSVVMAEIHLVKVTQNPIEPAPEPNPPINIDPYPSLIDAPSGMHWFFYKSTWDDGVIRDGAILLDTWDRAVEYLISKGQTNVVLVRVD